MNKRRTSIQRLRSWLRGQQRRFHLQWPPVGTVRFGSLRRLSPVSETFAAERGKSVVRHYIEQFLASNSQDIRGNVLEFGDNRYTRMFWKPQINKSDVLNVVDGIRGTTIVADLSAEVPVEPNTYDCIICTQTLEMIFEIRAALRTLYRLLKPGGVLLVTSSGINKIAAHEGRDAWAEYWHFTSQCMRRLFGEQFPPESLDVQSYGNVLAAVCFLHGLAAEELRTEELDFHHADYELIVAVRAVKPRV